MIFPRFFLPLSLLLFILPLALLLPPVSPKWPLPEHGETTRKKQHFRPGVIVFFFAIEKKHRQEIRIL